MMDVPKLILLVTCEIAPNNENASFPQDSSTQMESNVLFLSISEENLRISFVFNRESDQSNFKFHFNFVNNF